MSKKIANICPNCGDDRTGKGSLILRTGRVFCSERCFVEWRDRNDILICESCGNDLDGTVCAYCAALAILLNDLRTAVSRFTERCGELVIGARFYRADARYADIDIDLGG